MKTTLPARDIQAAVEARLGAVSDFEPLPEGLVSQVYGFRQGETRFVARVGPSASGFRKDAFAWRAFGSDALPIPEIVAIDSLGEAAICLSRRATGVRVHRLGADASALAPAIVDILAALARADIRAVAGFGVFDDVGQAPCRSWREHLLRVADARLYDWASVAGRLGRVDVDKALRAIERYAPMEAPSRGLVHGDFGSANLIAAGRRISAVIDWDRALVGDPAYDEANLLFWGEDRLQAVRSLIARAHVGDADWARRMVCYQLRIGLEEIYDAVTGRTPVAPDWLIARCAELIAEADRMAV
jgi:hygromycin-B 4-O-kinase